MEIRRFSCLLLTVNVTFLLAAAGSTSAQGPLISPDSVWNDPGSQWHPAANRIQPSSPHSSPWNEAVDASFQADNYGAYVGGIGALSNASVGAMEIGIFKMPTAWSTVRFGGVSLVSDGQGMTGGELGVRFHTPTRLAPYVGLSGVLEVSGFSRRTSYNRYYYQDGHRMNNPRWGYYPTGMAAIVPEIGVSYWATATCRLNVGTSYFVTSGSQPDFLAMTVSLDFALRPYERYISYPAWTGEAPQDPYFFSDGPATPDVDLYNDDHGRRDVFPDFPSAPPAELTPSTFPDDSPNPLPAPLFKSENFDACSCLESERITDCRPPDP